MEGSAHLFWGMFFGAIGLGYFIYGRKQKKIVPLLTGLALFVFPYLVSDVYLLVVAGVILVATPYFIRA